MQKVEELTLYLIDKDKQITAEKEFNKQQQSQIESLTTQVDELKRQMELILKKNAGLPVDKQ